MALPEFDYRITPKIAQVTSRAHVHALFVEAAHDVVGGRLGWVGLIAAAPHAIDAQTLTGVQNRVTVRYADANGSSGAAEAGVTVVVDRGASVHLFKRVDRALAGAGDTLTYTLRWESSALPAGGLDDEPPPRRRAWWPRHGGSFRSG